MPAVHQPRAVEQRDRAGRQREHQHELPVLAFFFERGRDHPQHQEQPEQQADEQGDLPDAAEIDVLVALWPK